MVRRPKGRKLLVATAGLATLTYVACKHEAPTGNLPAPMPEPTEMPVGNLPAPMPDPTATATPSAEPTAAPPEPSEMPVGNLPAPMPLPPESPKQ